MDQDVGDVSRPTASDRLRRIVTILPWIAARPGVTLQEISQQFGVSAEDVSGDLEVVFMVGVPPYGPDDLIDVITEGDRVTVRLGGAFTRPLRLTDQELLSLYLAVRAMLAAGAGPHNAVLASASGKLATALGLEHGERITVDLGDADPDILKLCRGSLDQGTQLDLSYYSFTSNQERQRTVDPKAVLSRDGHWYLWGWCHEAGDDRMFRVDRIRTAEASDRPVRATNVGDAPDHRPDPTSGATVTLALDRSVAGLLDEYRPLVLDDLSDGRAVRSVRVGGDAWLARLMLQLGPYVQVVDQPDDDRSLTPAEVEAIVAPIAERVIDRYR